MTLFIDANNSFNPRDEQVEYPSKISVVATLSGEWLHLIRTYLVDLKRGVPTIFQMKMQLCWNRN